MPSDASYRFGPFLVDRPTYRLLRDGAHTPLSPKLIDLLLYFLDNGSRLVTKDELMDALWPDVHVTENALAQAISELRQALGDDPAAPIYIQTVARRGYRFVCPAVRVETAPAPAPAADAASRKGRAIAVLDFANVTRDAEYAWLSSGVAETVTNDLRAFHDLRVIDRVRVVDAVSRAGSSPQTIARELDAALVVVGAFQRAGDRFRITARVVDVESGEAIADAKADGPLGEVFVLQDQIARQFAAGLGAGPPPSDPRPRVRETASLDAYRLFTEGRLLLESLDADKAGDAVALFERALALDPQYAAACVGLANACFWQYERSRAQNQPDAGLIAAAVGHARRAVALDDSLAEAHATLSFLLVGAGRFAEALAASRRAVALEPGYWAHYYRWGHAAWGAERLTALGRSRTLFPDFAFALFEMAMVHIARGDLPEAEATLQDGVVIQDRQADRAERFPARGLHWLLGLVRLARGDERGALERFDRELASRGAHLYAAEFTMDACDGAGFATLQLGDAAGAAEMFRRALALYPQHVRSQLGLVEALETDGRTRESEEARARGSAALQQLQQGRREVEASLMTAYALIVNKRPEEGVATLDQLLQDAPPGFAGWIIPIEPCFRSLHGRPDFARVLARVAERAR